MKKTIHTNLYSTIFLVSLVIGHVGLANPGVDWPMFQFDAAHTGYVPIHLDPNGFSLQWERTIGSLGSLNAVTAADGKVFASLGLGVNDDGTSFFVLNAATGETVWSKDFGRVYCVNPPSYAYGNVYIQTGRNSFLENKPYLRAYDADTGNLVFRSEFAAQFANYYAPTIYDGIVYVCGGYYGGMYAFDAYDGSEVWYKGLNMYDQWTPAVDDEYAYAYTGYGAVNQTPPASLSVVNRLTGQEAFRIVNPSHDWSGYSVRMAPVIGSKNNILITQYAIHYGGSLISFDLEQRKINWARKDDFTGQLSLARGVIYIINRGKLEARDEPTGNLLWSWDAPGEDLRGQIIVTNTHVLVSTEPLFPSPFSASPPTSSKVYAIDLLTHRNVWSYPIGGQLTIGNDALYIAQGRTLTAIEIALSPMVYYVDVDAMGANDGSSWADAYNDLLDALTAAWRGDEIRVAQGVYKPDEDEGGNVTLGDREATFQLISGVAIYGGYAGFGAPDPNERDPNIYETILSGDLDSNDEPNFTNYGENSYHVLEGSGTDKTAVLDGFNVQGGNANDLYPYNYGGGLYNHRGSPTIMNCVFMDNSSQERGGAIYNAFSSSIILNNCRFYNNKSEYGGGILNFYRSHPKIDNCIFAYNQAKGGAGMKNLKYSSPKLTNCDFIENIAKGDRYWVSDECGGAISNGYEKCYPQLVYCNFVGNKARNGGAVFSYLGTPNFTNCRFINNTAREKGGGIYNFHFSDTVLKNCLFTGNSAGIEGGALNNYRSCPNVINCTFSGNWASERGGAIYSSGGSFSKTSQIRMRNSIIWENSANYGNEIYVAYLSWERPTKMTVSYCNVQGGVAQTYVENNCTLNWQDSNINYDPNFISSGFWMDVNDHNLPVEPNHPNAIWSGGDYHLLPDSPCINAGDPNYIAEPNETDLDGNPRVIGGRIDMGAYEYPNTTPVACIVDGNRIVECEGCWGARVTLDGSCSSDADSTPGTNDDIVSFDWYKVDACDPNFEDFLASGEIIDCNLPLGEHIIVLEVIDKADAFDTNEVTIIVQDTTPPDFMLSVTPTVLWPANHKMVLIRPSWTASDICDESPEVLLVSITMNEGDGRTTDDIQIGDDGSIYLRAERSGSGSGRIYTITYQAVDDSGNAAVASATVTVPHDQR